MSTASQDSSAQIDSMSNYAFFFWRAQTTGAFLDLTRDFLSKDRYMKKRENTRKLSLSRETLRRLDATLLSKVAGGTIITCNPKQCTTDFGESLNETECCGPS
jgi:hypothetical protein